MRRQRRIYLFPPLSAIFPGRIRTLRLRVEDVTRAALPTVARGGLPSPILPSRLPGSRISAKAVERAHSSIRMRGLARALIKSQAAGRRLPNLRACPRTVINTSRPRAASALLFCAPLRAVRRGGDRVYISKDSIYIITVRF